MNNEELELARKTGCATASYKEKDRMLYAGDLETPFEIKNGLLYAQDGGQIKSFKVEALEAFQAAGEDNWIESLREAVANRTHAVTAFTDGVRRHGWPMGLLPAFTRACKGGDE